MIPDGLRHLVRAARGFSPDTRRFLAGSFLMGLGQGAASVHLNLYLAGAGLDETTIGNVLSATSTGLTIMALPAALLVDRLVPRRIFSLAAAGFSISVALMVLFPDPRLLYPLALADGALWTVHVVAVGPFFMRNEGASHRTELFGISAALEMAAMTVAALVAGYLAGWLGARFGGGPQGGQEGLRWALLIAAAVSALAVIPFSAIRSGPATAAPRGWRTYLVSKDLGLQLRLALPAFLVGCGAGLTIPFLNLYFRNRFGQGPEDIGFYYAVANVLTVTGHLAGPALARRFGHVRAIVATEVLSIPFFWLLAVTDRLRVAVGAFWMRGALMNMNQPVSQSFAMEIVPEDQRAVTNSLRTFAWNASWMVSTAAGGRLIEHHGFTPGMFVTMGLYLAAAATFWSFFRGTAVAAPAAVPAPAPAPPPVSDGPGPVGG